MKQLNEFSGRTRRLLWLALAGAVALLAAGCDRSLDRAKDAARKSLEAGSAAFSKVTPASDTIELKERPDAGPTEELPMKSGQVLIVPQPLATRRPKSDNPRVAMDYGDGSSSGAVGFKTIVFVGNIRPNWDDLPAAWGAGDLEKVKTISFTTWDAIDKAGSVPEVQDAVARLTARGTVLPFGALERVDFIRTAHVEGMLCGDIAVGRQTFVFRPLGTTERGYYQIELKAIASPAQRAAILDYLSVVRVK